MFASKSSVIYEVVFFKNSFLALLWWRLLLVNLTLSLVFKAKSSFRLLINRFILLIRADFLQNRIYRRTLVKFLIYSNERILDLGNSWLGTTCFLNNHRLNFLQLIVVLFSDLFRFFVIFVLLNRLLVRKATLENLFSTFKGFLLHCAIFESH